MLGLRMRGVVSSLDFLPMVKSRQFGDLSGTDSFSRRRWPLALCPHGAYNTLVRVKGLVGLFLSLAIGACSCLMPLAAAASLPTASEHSCCASHSPDKHHAHKSADHGDCCIRAALPVTPHAPIVSRSFVAFVPAGRRVRLPAGRILLDSAALSPPPDSPPVPSSASRAPPAVV